MEGKIVLEEPKAIGSYCGFDLLVKRAMSNTLCLVLRGKVSRDIDIGVSGQGMVQRLNNALNHIDQLIADNQQSLARLHEQLEKAKENVNKPWAQEDEYQAKVARLNELHLHLSKQDAQFERQQTMHEVVR